MSRDSSAAAPDDSPERDTEAGGDDVPEIDEGRYVYCVVRVQGDTSIETHGVDDEPVRLVVASGSDADEGEPALGAVVHDCAEIYDSADPAELRRWLVRHQRVVDDAGEAFGTPLPFQFDTIIRGDDEAVREWLREERDALTSALDGLAGHWEYRIEVVRTDPVAEERLRAEDDRLAELREEAEAADPGRAYLIEKQYEDRLSNLRRQRRDALADDAIERVAPHVREVHELDPSPARSIAGGDEGATEGELVCRLTVLAHEADEEALGSALDEVAAEPGVEVRFTGPWPPYTYAPSFGDDGDDRADARDGDDRGAG